MLQKLFSKEKIKHVLSPPGQPVILLLYIVDFLSLVVWIVKTYGCKKSVRIIAAHILDGFSE